MSAIYTETKNIAISIRIFIQLLRLVCLVRVFFIRVAIFFSLNCCNLIYIGNLIVLYRFEACYKPVRMVNVNGKKSHPLSALRPHQGARPLSQYNQDLARKLLQSCHRSNQIK